ncbi:hypothetical protein BX666DRAFT_2023091 [Dichotomocladium elegans]|nr:hypothetical protein BX666DRAFT_2023091 [Dichotomocladium elegans]
MHRQPDSENTALGTQRNAECDRIRPLCGECHRNGTECQYTSINATVAEQIQVRTIETRLKKIEAQFFARSAAGGGGGSNSSGSMIGGSAKKNPVQAKGGRNIVKPSPKFSIAPGGLCIETDITEAHHLVKLLFSTIDVEKIEQRARAMFDITMPIPKDIGAMPELATTLMPQLLSMDDQIEEAWLDMVITSRHHRCLIIYQMVGRERVSWPTSYLRQLAAENRVEELLLAMSMRAYIYQHQSELHQDSEFSFRTSKGHDYVQCAKVLLERCFLVSSRITIRALLHLFLFYVHHRPEESFQYSDLAIRMAQDLELHKKGRDNDDEDDRRLWWAVYWCHMSTVVLFDRPFMMTDEEIEVDFPCKLPEEEADVGYCIDYCVMSIKLVRIHRMIAQSLRKRWEIGPFLRHIQLIEEQLEGWQKTLPLHARVDIDRYEQDNLCIELGMMLNSQLQGIKIQLYQCFLENSQPLSLIAIQSCNRALSSVADMLIRFGPAMRMCACIRILPAIHQCVAVLAESTQSNESLIEFRRLQSVLTSHSFSFLKEMRAIADLIGTTLDKFRASSVEKPSTPNSNSSNNSGSTTIVSTPEQKTQSESMNNITNATDGSTVMMGNTHRSVSQIPAESASYQPNISRPRDTLFPISIGETFSSVDHNTAGLIPLPQGVLGSGGFGNIGGNSNAAPTSLEITGNGTTVCRDNNQIEPSQGTGIHQQYIMLEQQSVNDSLLSRNTTVAPRQEWIASSSSGMNLNGHPPTDMTGVDRTLSSVLVPNSLCPDNANHEPARDIYVQSWQDTSYDFAHSDPFTTETSTAANTASQYSVPILVAEPPQSQILDQLMIREPAPMHQWVPPVESVSFITSNQQDYLKQWPLVTTENIAVDSLLLNLGDMNNHLLRLDSDGQQSQGHLQQLSAPESDVSGISSQLPLSTPTATSRIASFAAEQSTYTAPPAPHPVVVQQQQQQQQLLPSSMLLPLDSSLDVVQLLSARSELARQQDNLSTSAYGQRLYSQPESSNSGALANEFPF